MAQYPTRWPTLARTMLNWDGEDGLLCCGLLVLAGAALLTISAKVQVPFWPAPITMQTFVVLLIGAGFGLRLGLATVGVYLAEGAAGWPVFAGGSGYAYFAGPAGGYLIGFLAAVAVVGFMAERGYDRRWHTALLTFLIGDIVLFAFGLAWLAHLFGIWKAIAVGLLPYLLAEASKIALAMAILPFIWKFVGSGRYRGSAV